MLGETYLPVYEETLNIKDYTTMSHEELLLKNRELNIWLLDPFISDRQLREVKRIQEHIIFEVHSRIREGSLKRNLGKIAVA